MKAGRELHGDDTPDEDLASQLRREVGTPQTLDSGDGQQKGLSRELAYLELFDCSDSDNELADNFIEVSQNGHRQSQQSMLQIKTLGAKQSCFKRAEAFEEKKTKSQKASKITSLGLLNLLGLIQLGNIAILLKQEQDQGIE